MLKPFGGFAKTWSGALDVFGFLISAELDGSQTTAGGLDGA
jgi:hypothetical protein